MAADIGPQIGIEGEKEFKQAINGITKDMNVLGSEMKLASQTFSDNANSVEALTKKDELLNKQVDLQKEKVTALKNALENAKTTYGENSSEVKNWQVKLNNADTDLSKLNNGLKTNDKYLGEAKTSTNGLATSIDSYGKEVKTAGDNTLKTGDIIKANLTSEAIISGVKALGSAVVNVAKSTVDLAVGAATYADDMLTMSTQTGISTDKLQAYNYMSELTDVSLEDMTKTMAKNIKSMANAQDGSEKYASAYKALGVSVVDSNGNLKDSEEVYWSAIDALGKMTNETERDSLSMQLFGKSAQDLNPLIAIGSAGVANFTAEAKSMGAILSTDTLNGLGATDDALQRMYQSVDIAKRKFGAEMAPAVAEAVTKITDKISGMDDEIANMASGALSTMADGLGWVIDNSDLVVAGLSGIGAAMLTSATVGVVNQVVVGMKAFTVATEGAAIAQTAFNVAQKANLIGIAATAIIGLGTTMVVYGATQKKTTNEFDIFNDKIKEVQAESKKLSKEIASSEDTFSDSTKEVVSNYGAVQILSDKLYDLSDKENKSNSEKAQMQILVGQLNESIPDLNLVMSEQTGILNLQKDQVDGLVQSMKDKALAQAYEERYLEVANEQAAAQVLLKDATDKATEAQNNYNDAVAKVDELQKNSTGFNPHSKEYKEASENVDKYKVSLVFADATATAATKTLDSFKGKFNDLDDAIGVTADTTKDYASTTETSQNKASEATEVATAKATEQLEALQKTYTETKESATESITSQIGLFDKFSSKVEFTNKEILDNLKTQIEGVKNWSSNIAYLAEKGINDGLLKELREMGPESAGYVSELVKMTDTQIVELNKLWSEKLDVTDSIATELAEAAVKAESSGGNIVLGLVNGIISKGYLAKKAAQDLASTTLNSLNAKLEVQSPSKKAKESGLFFSEGLAIGITEGGKKAKLSSEEIAVLILASATKRLDNYKVYNDLSLKEEMTYWNQVRIEVKKGTQARIDADKEYFDAKVMYKEQQATLAAEHATLLADQTTVEETYKNNCKRINAELITDVEAATTSYNNAVTSRTQSIVSSMGLFDSFSATKDATGQDLLSNLESQVQGISDWQTNLGSLQGKGIGDGLLAELQDMGVKSSGEVAALNSLTEKELERYVYLWETKTMLAKSQAVNELVGLKEETSVKIKELNTQANKDLTSYYKIYKAAMSELGVAIKEPINQVKATIGEDGEAIVKNVAKSMKKEATNKDTKSALKSVTDSMMDSMQSAVSQSITLGVNMAQGMIMGMNSQKSALSLMSGGLVTGAIAGARLAGLINSPSRKTAELVGLPLAQGIGVGFTNAMLGITEEMANVVPTSFNTDVNMSGEYNQSSRIPSGSVSSEVLTNMVTSIIGNMKLSATVEAPFILGTQEFGRAVIKVQLANDEMFNATPKYA